MLRYVVRRLLLLVPILLGVSILIFFWVHALPGNPASALLGERATYFFPWPDGSAEAPDAVVLAWPTAWPP